MPSHTRSIAAAATALAAAAALAVSGPADAANVDPSAFGVAATGPSPIPAQPSVSWTSGPALTGSSPGLNSGALHVGAMAVAAGEGYSAARVAELRYGDTVAVRSLLAVCSGGHTTVAVSGTAGGRALRPGARIALPGGYALVGASTTNADGTTTVAGLTVVDGSEELTAAVSRC